MSQSIAVVNASDSGYRLLSDALREKGVNTQRMSQDDVTSGRYRHFKGKFFLVDLSRELGAFFEKFILDENNIFLDKDVTLMSPREFNHVIQNIATRYGILLSAKPPQRKPQNISTWIVLGSAGSAPDFVKLLSSVPQLFDSSIVCATHTNESGLASFLLMMQKAIPGLCIRDSGHSAHLRAGEITVIHPEKDFSVSRLGLVECLPTRKSQSFDLIIERFCQAFNPKNIGVIVLSGLQVDAFESLQIWGGELGNLLCIDPESVRLKKLPEAVCKSGHVQQRFTMDNLRELQLFYQAPVELENAHEATA